LATVLLYAIAGMVAAANSCRQVHEFIRIDLQRLNEAFGLRLRYSPCYAGLRTILPQLSRRRPGPSSSAVSVPTATARRRSACSIATIARLGPPCVTDTDGMT
jgi:hypothetical protein